MSSPLATMAFLCLVALLAVTQVGAAIINVSSISALQSAINSSAPGDEIVIANGTYSGSTISIPSGKNGVIVRSATPGGVFLTGTCAITIGGNSNIFSGFRFNSSSTGNIVVVVTGSYNHVTQLDFNGVSTQKYIHLNTPGLHNVISYCNFKNKPTGATIVNLVHVSADASNPGYHNIQRCSFQDMPGAGGDAGNECIRLENGAQSTRIARTVIEYCYFSNTQGGDSETISFKCRENVVRYCTMTNNQNAQFVFRNGNDNVAYGNFFMGAAGFRVKEANNCYMYNNYFENSGVGGINGCVEYVAAPGFGQNIHFTHNTVVNSGVIHFEGQTANQWANNIFSYASGNIFSGTPSGITFLGNMYQGTLGVSIPSGMTSVNPQLARNSDGWLGLAAASPAIDAGDGTWPALMDIANVDDDPTLTLDTSGQSRPASKILKDVGCDEYGVNVTLNRPLALSDVGPSYLGGPSGNTVAAPTFSPVAGTYTSAQSVTISTTTSGASIRYTVDGSTPTSNTGTLYSSPVNIGVSTTLKAIAYKSGMTDSALTMGIYTITACNPPTITGNPSSTSACAGSTAGFSVTATGDGLTYQWQLSVGGGGFNNISGATSSSYTTPATVTGDNGNQYRCVVNGTCGTATSTAATTTVNARPTSVASGTATICSGGLTTIHATLTGTGPWNVTWSDGNVQNGIAASPATRSVSPVSTTTYTVTVLTDANCTAQAGDRTGSAVVTVNNAPSITTQPQSQTVIEGANVSVSVTATGTAPLTYQWRKGGVNLGGATSSTYSLTAVTTNDAGNYDVVVNNSCGTATSTAATLTVNVSSLPAPWLTADIGAVGIAGSASHSAGVYTIKGSGTGIAGTSDQFRYVYQTLSGDGSITVRLTSQSGTTTASLAGVMIRETTATGSRFAGVWRRGSGNNNMRAVRRTSTGGSVTSTTSTSQTPPNCWVRITRTGSSFVMARSTNGTSWTTINTSSITMASEITVGILVTSGSNSVPDTDVFDNVTVVP